MTGPDAQEDIENVKSLYEERTEEAEKRWQALSNAILNNDVGDVLFHKIGINPTNSVHSGHDERLMAISKQALYFDKKRKPEEIDNKFARLVEELQMTKE